MPVTILTMLFPDPPCTRKMAENPVTDTLAQVRVDRSRLRVVRVVGRRRARLLFGIVLWCEHTTPITPNAANLGGAG